MRNLILLICSSAILSGCCSGLKESIRGYGQIAASSADTTKELIRRCRSAADEADAAKKKQDQDACDAASAAQDAAKNAAIELTKVQ
jgi:hypothetical protein